MLTSFVVYLGNCTSVDDKVSDPPEGESSKWCFLCEKPVRVWITRVSRGISGGEAAGNPGTNGTPHVLRRFGIARSSRDRATSGIRGIFVCHPRAVSMLVYEFIRDPRGSSSSFAFYYPSSLPPRAKSGLEQCTVVCDLSLRSAASGSANRVNIAAERSGMLSERRAVSPFTDFLWSATLLNVFIDLSTDNHIPGEPGQLLSRSLSLPIGARRTFDAHFYWAYWVTGSSSDRVGMWKMEWISEYMIAFGGSTMCWTLFRSVTTQEPVNGKKQRGGDMRLARRRV